MTEARRQILAAAGERSGSAPASFMFGDGIDWSSPLAETRLYVELPFWLMTPAAAVSIDWSGGKFTVDVCPAWMEIFGGEVRDSRTTVMHHGPWRPSEELPQSVAEDLARTQTSWLGRPCKTVLRLTVAAHTGAFRSLDSTEPPRARAEQEAYWASLCEAHIPVVNELIQRYRLVTYDYFAYEVSAWDVPVWYVTQGGAGYRALLMPYKGWDTKPVTIEDAASGDPSRVQPFQWAEADSLSTASSGEATPGEFDLLDARSLMERGDYTGAVRRAVTAIEAVLRWALVRELEKKLPPEEVEARAANTDNDFPGRLAQWRKLAQPQISQQEFDEFDTTRKIRHEIVHRGRRLTHEDRGRAQRAVDTGRWLYNKIEGNAARAQLRDRGALKSVGRAALVSRFPAVVNSSGITLIPITGLRRDVAKPDSLRCCVCVRPGHSNTLGARSSHLSRRTFGLAIKSLPRRFIEVFVVTPSQSASDDTAHGLLIELRALEVRVRQVRPSKVRASEVGALQVNFLHRGLLKLRSSQICLL